jgi:hypothetical protein
LIAKVLLKLQAIRTNTTGVTEPRNAYSFTDAQTFNTSADPIDSPYDLVPRYDRNNRAR